MPQEKRRFTRVPFKVKAELTVAGQRFTTDRIDNLSVGGCLLPLQLDLQPGASCQLKILMSGSSSDLHIVVDGEILRAATDLTAVRFIRIEQDSLYHLQNIILYNADDTDKVEREINDHPGIR
jgi:hypothetical protein